MCLTGEENVGEGSVFGREGECFSWKRGSVLWLSLYGGKGKCV